MPFNIGRRQFLSALGGATIACPLAAHAQQAKPVSRIGMLTSAPVTSPIENAFLQSMRDLGYVQGQNLMLEYRGGTGRAKSLDNFAAELIALKVDVILASGSEATRAAQQQTTAIP